MKMSIYRQETILRERNAQLQKELDILKEQSINPRVDAIVHELESIRDEWKENLEKLIHEREQYASLVKDLKTIKEALNSMKER